MAKPDPKPWHPVPYKDADIYALQAVNNGVASAEQQKIAMRWIVHIAGSYNDMPWYPGDETGKRDTDFANGRRFVALQIVKLLSIHPTKETV